MAESRSANQRVGSGKTVSSVITAADISACATHELPRIDKEGNVSLEEFRGVLKTFIDLKTKEPPKRSPLKIDFFGEAYS